VDSTEYFSTFRVTYIEITNVAKNCRRVYLEFSRQMLQTFITSVRRGVRDRAGFTPSGAPVQKKLWGP